MSAQRDALLRLLSDDDAHTVRLVQGQLACGGAGRLPELRSLLADARGAAARSIRQVISEIEEREADVIFQQMCAEFPEHGDLEAAAWKLARVFVPGSDFDAPQTLLDLWGAEVRRRLKRADSPLDQLETLTEFLDHEVRFEGNSADYYNLENSLLPQVIENRTGIPITLTLVHMLVGRRAGLEIEGVGLPGHFLARFEDMVFDPFHGGRRVSFEECRGLMLQQNLKLTLEHLRPATPRQMLLRMLTNILHIARETEPLVAAKVSTWIDALSQRFAKS